MASNGFHKNPIFLGIMAVGMVGVVAVLVVDHQKKAAANVATAQEWDIKAIPAPA